MTPNHPTRAHIVTTVHHLLSRARIAPVAAILLAMLTIGIVAELATIVRIGRVNHAISAPAGRTVDDSDPPQLIFAKAYHLDAEGRHQEALRLYNLIEYENDPELRERVKYNMGTIYLSEAAQLWQAEGVGAYARLNTLLELAESAYREVLRLNDRNWDARYNLEYALSIRPPEKTVDKADWKGRRSSVFAVFPGIPGGGP